MIWCTVLLMATTRKAADKAEENTPSNLENSPLKLVVRQSVELEVDGTVYSGDIEVSSDDLNKLSSAAMEWDAVQKDYAQKTADLVDMMSDLGMYPQRKTRKGPSGKSEAAYIRLWAERVGHEVAPKGAIPSNIKDAYHRAKDSGKLEEGEY